MARTRAAQTATTQNTPAAPATSDVDALDLTTLTRDQLVTLSQQIDVELLGRPADTEAETW